MERFSIAALHLWRVLLATLAGGLTLWVATTPGWSQTSSIEELVSAVVQVKAQIEPDGTTVSTLGREREGSGVVIDSDGLVLTIGYLMVEARSAEIRTNDGRTVPAMVVGYDHETGFGLLRALVPLRVAPMPLGHSSELKAGEPALVASTGGLAAVGPVRIAAKREFAGSWEYLLDEAIFTSPPHLAWSGAALIDRGGRLVGIGSLVVGDIGGDAKGPGNMFVPVDLLRPILAELLAHGRTPAPGRPWLGVTANEVGGALVTARVTPGGPAARAGVQPGATIKAVSGAPAKNLADFYRKVWATGGAGAVVTLTLAQDGAEREVAITSADRLAHLKLKSSL